MLPVCNRAQSRVDESSGLLIGLTLGQSDTSNACPPYWVHHGLNCYGVITHLLADWMEAVTFCRDINAEIVEIETKEENLFLKNFLVRNHTNVDIWIGGTDAFEEGHWLWINSQRPVTFTDWAPLEPYQGKGFECMTLTGRQGFRWNDDDCSHKLGFICRKEAINEGTIIIG
uniref:Perlucin-like isoform X1 n=1 Tax=Crassostrea virginica TaxID=6565 RepID=A0A8B8ARZ9_CRAVI|nr:perlucin-like isoform X3 [Crassostrea virginica]XP_022294207.1 perlucin-like isoform X1 [Crassostrea virginica]